MPLEGVDLVLEPRYPHAQLFPKKEKPKPEEYDANCKLRNSFYATSKRRSCLVWSEPSGRIEWGLEGTIHHFTIDMETMGASVAWGIEQEASALQTLAELLPHHAFKKYLLTGMFVEQSKRSNVYYFFRRLKPYLPIRLGRDRFDAHPGCPLCTPCSLLSGDMGRCHVPLMTS